MKRAFAVVSVVVLLLLAALFHTPIKDFLWTHPWWHSFLAALPTISLPILAYLEWRDSGKASTLQAKANDLQGRVAELIAKLDAERNEHLQQIAKNTQRPVTQAERNANTLRKHLGAKVAVNEGGANWPGTPEIVKVGDDNIVTLFTPRGYSSSGAWCASVQCSQLEITEIPQGSCPIRINVLRRHGQNVQLGEITRWEDRLQPAAAPTFAKSGGAACSATYSKPGSPERRSLHVFASRDGANSFLLEVSAGEDITGDNVEISKRFMLLQIEYQAEGFTRNTFGTGGGGGYPLFIT